jgi:DNA helicase-2/ATP-dependent DNA helicase PcrA
VTTINRSTAGAARASRICTSSARTFRRPSCAGWNRTTAPPASILDAANALIANNSGRLGKNLWTSGARGDAVKVYAAFNERDEADFVVTRILEWSQRGGARREVAILYRSNAQSRTFEEALITARVPYRVYGGLRFFERAEIKDALAYLRLIANRDDDGSFERIVNLPPRGSAPKLSIRIRDAARGAGSSLWRAPRRRWSQPVKAAAQRRLCWVLCS